MSECIFCRIISREIEVPILAESKRAIIIKDRAPAASVHLLVISKVHVTDLTQEEAVVTDDNHREPLGAVMHLARKYAKENLPGGFRIVLNTGSDAGQTVKHLHAHVLGGEKLKDL